MPLTAYSKAELSPRKLSKEEIENPRQVINDFFSFGHLPQIREQLWEFLKIAITGNFTKSLSLTERAGLIYFYEHIEKLIEAAHLIHQQKEIDLKKKG